MIFLQVTEGYICYLVGLSHEPRRHAASQSNKNISCYHKIFWNLLVISCLFHSHQICTFHLFIPQSVYHKIILLTKIKPLIYRYFHYKSITWMLICATTSKNIYLMGNVYRNWSRNIWPVGLYGVLTNYVSLFTIMYIHRQFTIFYFILLLKIVTNWCCKHEMFRPRNSWITSHTTNRLLLDIIKGHGWFLFLFWI